MTAQSATTTETAQTRIPPTDLTGVFGTVVKFAARRMVGRVPDSMRVLAHHPALMRASMGIGRKIEALDELDRDLATYAVMATAIARLRRVRVVRPDLPPEALRERGEREDLLAGGLEVRETARELYSRTRSCCA